MGRPLNANPLATRERVLAAARTVALRDGIMAVTVDRVAREAGVAKSTVGPASSLFEHLIDYTFAALVAAHAGLCAQDSADRWRAHKMSVELLANEPDLAVLVLIACTLAAPSAPSAQAAGHARRFRQMHLAARRAIAVDAIASRAGTFDATAQDYSADVVADYLEIAAETWASQLL